MLEFLPVRVSRKSGPFSIIDLLNRASENFRDDDILIISSKFIAISEGRIVSLRTVVPTPGAMRLASTYNLPPELCELVIRESDEILGGVVGFILTSKDGLLTPNAGIDKSNIEYGNVVLYPRDSMESATMIVNAMKFYHGIEVGVVVSDSRLMPTRRGTTGVALAAVGLEAVLDLRGRPDLFGNILRVTSQAIADDISSGAQLLMGEADEATPIVVMRGLNKRLLKRVAYSSSNFSVSLDQDVYMRSLGHSRQTDLPAS